MPPNNATRLCIVQYGDYRAALQARDNDEPETYRAQYYSLQVVDDAMRNASGLILCLDAAPYSLTRGPLSIRADRFVPEGHGLFYRFRALQNVRRILDILGEFKPTHCIIRTQGFPFLPVCRWALRHGVHVLPLFADYFRMDSLRERLRQRPLVSMLNVRQVPLIANHNFPACRSMIAAGVDARKIVAYDWPAQRNPADFPCKLLPEDHSIRLCYAGQISSAKGVGDLLQAIALLDSRHAVRLDLFGEGPERLQLEQTARSLGLHCVFHGITANRLVLQTMQQAHLVVVPSRHEYPEGLPCVIYEALETRTPAIVSDHPSFLEKLEHGKGCLIFSAGNAEAMARSMDEALSSPELYARLSHGTERAWQAIQCPVTFGELVFDWLDNATHPERLQVLQHAIIPGGTA